MMNTDYLFFTVKYNQDDTVNGSSSGKQQKPFFFPVKLMILWGPGKLQNLLSKLLHKIPFNITTTLVSSLSLV